MLFGWRASYSSACAYFLRTTLIQTKRCVTSTATPSSLCGVVQKYSGHRFVSELQQRSYQRMASQTPRKSFALALKGYFCARLASKPQLWLPCRRGSMPFDFTTQQRPVIISSSSRHASCESVYSTSSVSRLRPARALRALNNAACIGLICLAEASAAPPPVWLFLRTNRRDTNG